LNVVTCGECAGEAVLVTGAAVYPHREELHARSYWRCSCGAFVGCHPGTVTPLGTPANGDLRRLRMQLHSIFDPIWERRRVKDGLSKGAARRAAYAWLALEVGTDPRDTHIGKFTREQCRKAIDAIEQGGAA
jgi:hypothetical protein